MEAVPLCKCGKPAVFNESTSMWELCSDCQKRLKHSVICEEIIRLFGKKYKSASLDHFNENLVESLIEDTLHNGRNILFTGDSSTGKTYLMAALYAYMFNNGCADAYYINNIALYAQIDADITCFEKTVNMLSSYPILFLDEYTNPNNTWEDRLLYLILENRKNDEKLTISATNLNSNGINGRFYSRLLENNGVEYKITRKSWNVK